MRKRNRGLGVTALLLIAAMAIPASARIASSGAKGFAHRYNNRSWTAWMTLGPMRDSSWLDCHVEYVRDGSWPGGWGGAQMDSLGTGNWVELKKCMIVDGAASVRVNGRSRLTLRDPLDDPARLPTQEDSCDCDTELPPGTRVWTTGPEDPSIDWPPPRLWTVTASAWPDTASGDSFEYVIDHDETSGITRVTNHPFAMGVVLVRAATWDPSIPDMPLLPGQSALFMPDGTLGPPGEVLVRGLGDVIVRPGEPAELFFEVWNLSASPATFLIYAEDSEGSDVTVSDPTPTIPAMSFQTVAVNLTVLPTHAVIEDMVTVTAESEGLTPFQGPAQTDWDAAFVEVDTTATAVAERPTQGVLWLGQCQPNPFNPTTWIPYELPVLAHVRVDVHDATGRHVATLVDAVQTAGGHAAVWDGRNARGEPVASGVYFYRLTVAGQQSLVKKMVLLK